MLIDPVISLLPMAQDKKVIGLAVTTAKRSKLAPEYPTAAESGLPGMDHASWYGVWGPKGMAADLVTSLNAVIKDAVAQLDKDGKLAQVGIEAANDTPAQLAEFASGYAKRNADLLKAANFEPM